LLRKSSRPDSFNLKNEFENDPNVIQCITLDIQKSEKKMNKTAVVSARIAPEVKSKAEKILNKLGLTTTEAITMLFQQINLRQGIPFPVEIPNEETMRAIREADAGIGTTRVHSVDELRTAIES
jgi:DNA-damage-inducible protein J